VCKILFAIRKFVVLKNYWFVLNVCFLTHILGKGLFCCRKPPKTEKALNENTHYQRAHKKNVVMSSHQIAEQNQSIVLPGALMTKLT
jgi:hypothetical protein